MGAIMTQENKKSTARPNKSNANKSNSKSKTYKGKTSGAKGKTAGPKGQLTSKGKKPARKKPPVQGFNFNNIEKKNKNFMYQNLTKSKCYNCNFSGSNFDYVSFRGAHFKSCKFEGSTFTGAEFIGSNLKESNFKDAQFDFTVFESVKLSDTDFKGAEFNNAIFLSCNLDEAKNLDLTDENIKVFDEMPLFEISDGLRRAVETVMENKYVKKSRVMDTREGKINFLSLMILLDVFDEEKVIKGFEKLVEVTDRDFYTLSYIIKIIGKVE